MGDGVANANEIDLLDAGDQIADLAGTESLNGFRRRSPYPDLVGIDIETRCHESDRILR